MVITQMDRAPFRALREDFRSHNSRLGAQGFWVMVVYRFGRWRYTLQFTPARKICSALYAFAFKVVQILTGIELPCEADVGQGFVIDHFGGIIISGHARIGRSCRIRSGVVIGLRHIDDPRAPTIGDNVDVGTGAKLLGPIKIGNNVLIGANAVVLCDVPDDSIAVGVPAIVKPRVLGKR